MPSTQMPPELTKFLKDIRQEMRDMRSAIEKELRKEFKDMKQSIDFFSTQFDAMATRCSAIEKENASLKKENTALITKCRELGHQVAGLEERVTTQEQYSRNKNVEIKGVPFVKNENLSAVLGKLGSLVGESVCDSDVDVCHRVSRQDGGCPNVVVQFRSRTKRDGFIEKARKKRISATDLGHSDDTSIFINEHLCPTLKKLLGQAVARKKERQWKYVWTREGKVFARKSDNSRVLRISVVQDLEKME